jgi:hypothetical protein
VAHRLEVSGLRRAIRDAHEAAVKGALPFGEGGLVSWGADGAICFWSAEGRRLEDRGGTAHDGGTEGVLPFGEGGLVSWGADGALRLWTAEGRWAPPAICPPGGIRRLCVPNNGVDRRVWAVGRSVWLYEWN